MRLVLYFVCWFFALLLLGCSFGDESKDKQREMAFDQQRNDISGVWIAEDSSFWVPRLEFRKKDTAIYYPLGDTILYFIYKVKNNKIELNTFDNRQMFHDSILSRNDSFMVLNSVVGIKRIQKYFNK